MLLVDKCFTSVDIFYFAVGGVVNGFCALSIEYVDLQPLARNARIYFYGEYDLRPYRVVVE